MKNNNYLSIAAIFLAAVAICMCVLCCLSKEKIVAEALNKNPGMVIEALQKYEQVAKDEQFAAAKAVIVENADAINNDPATPFVGKADSKVVLAMFYDYSCGYCHRLYPVLKEIASKNPDIKVVFKPLTFLGPISEYAAKSVIAANMQGKFKEFNDALFAYQGQLTEDKIDEIAGNTGLSLEQLKADMNSEAVLTALAGVSDLASKVQINGVPTMILDNQMLQTFDAAEIQKAIDDASK